MDQSHDERAASVNNDRTHKHQNRLTGVCSNKQCPHRNTGIGTEFIELDNIEREYCIECAVSVKAKWICPYCTGVGNRDDSGPEHNDWVQCCIKACRQWVHQDCEKQKGFKDIKTRVLDRKYKYMCLNCRSRKPPKKSRELGQEGRKPDKFGSREELRRTLLIKRKLIQTPYVYLHSESYQSIEKVLTLVDKNAPTLALNDQELKEDFTFFNECIGRSEFDVPGNCTVKALTSRLEPQVRSFAKKITKRAQN